MLSRKTPWQTISREHGTKRLRNRVSLFIFALLLQLACIVNLDLSGRDSPRVAGIAREMELRSDFLIPRLNGEPFLEYPPLGYWPIAVSLSLSSEPHDFLALLPMVLLGAGTVLITFLIGTSLAGEEVGLIAGFMLSTMVGFTALHGSCSVDPALLFFVTLSLYGFTAAHRATGRSRLDFGLFYLAMALGFLSKGIIGVAIPAATVAVFMMVRRDFADMKRLLLGPGVLFFLVPILLWAASVWYLDGSGALAIVIRQSLWRFLSPSTDHAETFYYYFLPAVLNLMPWTLLPLALLWHRSRRSRSEDESPNAILLTLALAWFTTVLVGLSVASAKRALYLGPAFPPFALLAAVAWEQSRARFPRLRRVERSGVAVLFVIIAATYQLYIVPSANEKSFRPLFQAARSRPLDAVVYLVNPSEALRGASFFYLGRVVPAVTYKDFRMGSYEDRPEMTFVTESCIGDARVLSHLQERTYELVLRKEMGRGSACVYAKRRS